MSDKTVYLLGAGFSKSAGAPLQSEIIHDIITLPATRLLNFDYYQLFIDYREDLKKLLQEIFMIEPPYFKYFSLEDIYTPIDKCIADNISLRSLNKKELLDIRQKISALISMLMDYRLSSVSNAPITKFAKHLIELRKQAFEDNHDSDPFAIVSTNWDIIMESALKKQIRYAEEGDIDYCFYVHFYKYNSKLRSGLYLRG